MQLTAEDTTFKGRRVGDEPVMSVLPDGDVPILDRPYNADEEALAALGYKAEFKREFTLWTTFAVSFSVLGLLPSFASVMWYGLGYSGTGGMLISYVVWKIRYPARRKILLP